MSKKTNSWMFGGVFSFLWIALLIFVFLDVGAENPPTDYLGKWQTDKGAYIYLSKAEDGAMPDSIVNISNFRAALLIPVDARVSIPASFFWWDFWLRYNGRGGIYSIQGQHVLIFWLNDRECHVVFAVRKDGFKIQFGAPIQLDSYTPKNIHWKTMKKIE